LRDHDPGMLIQLLTRRGEFILSQEIPDYSMSPEVVLWGQRTFCKVPVRRATDPLIGVEYREVMAYTLTLEEERA